MAFCRDFALPASDLGPEERWALRHWRPFALRKSLLLSFHDGRLGAGPRGAGPSFEYHRETARERSGGTEKKAGPFEHRGAWCSRFTNGAGLVMADVGLRRGRGRLRAGRACRSSLAACCRGWRRTRPVPRVSRGSEPREVSSVVRPSFWVKIVEHLPRPLGPRGCRATPKKASENEQRRRAAPAATTSRKIPSAPHRLAVGRPHAVVIDAAGASRAPLRLVKPFGPNHWDRRSASVQPEDQRAGRRSSRMTNSPSSTRVLVEVASSRSSARSSPPPSRSRTAPAPPSRPRPGA